jgi:ribonucleotide reductase alpha subunit
VCVSRHLLQDLIELGLWTPELKNKIIGQNGSIAAIQEIPAHIRALYKTVWSVFKTINLELRWAQSQVSFRSSVHFSHSLFLFLLPFSSFFVSVPLFREVSQRTIIDMAADRGAYIDQVGNHTTT